MKKWFRLLGLSIPVILLFASNTCLATGGISVEISCVPAQSLDAFINAGTTNLDEAGKCIWKTLSGACAYAQYILPNGMKDEMTVTCRFNYYNGSTGEDIKTTRHDFPLTPKLAETDRTFYFTDSEFDSGIPAARNFHNNTSSLNFNDNNKLTEKLTLNAGEYTDRKFSFVANKDITTAITNDGFEMGDCSAETGGKMNCNIFNRVLVIKKLKINK